MAAARIHATVPTVLLLDDDPQVVASLERSLDDAAFAIEGFTRPLDALHRMKTSPVAVVLLDLCMPQMDGREFLRLATRLCPSAVVIILSGYVEEELRLAGVRTLAWRSLAKPWDPIALKRTVVEALAVAAEAQSRSASTLAMTASL